MTETNKLREEIKKKAKRPDVCICALGEHIVWTNDEDGYISIDDAIKAIQKARDDLLDDIERGITNIIADEGLDISSRRVLELIEKLRSTVGKEGK